MKTATAIVSLALYAFPVNADTFNGVPANIADAPVEDWISVKKTHLKDKRRFMYRMRFPYSNVWVYELYKGIYWPEARFSSESRMVKQFKESGWKNIRNVESVAYAGSQWGYMAIEDWKESYKDCVIGRVLDSDNHSHDGGGGGTLQAYIADCNSDAENRFDQWKTWLKSFKRVPLGYNAKLDK